MRRAELALLVVALGCGTPSSPPGASAPVPAPVFATCEAACAQHCLTTAARAECEAVQVRCGCAPGMRRPPPAPSRVPPPPVPPPAPPTTPPATPPAGASAPDAPACFGRAIPLTLFHGTPYVEVQIGEARGAFLVDYGTTFSTLDVAALSPAPRHDGRCWPDAHLFDPWPCPTLRASGHGGTGAPFPQAGILGTDVLASHVHVLDLAGARMFRASPAAACSSGELTEAGLVRLDVLGWGSARRPAGVLVPAIVVDLGGARAPAQLDTGFADWRVARSINVNQSFFDAALAAGAALERFSERDLTLTTCVPGVSEPVEAYRLSSGALGWVAADGSFARSFEDVTVFLKRTPEAARRCGGIGTWTEPGAQLGASFLAGSRIVLDPERGEVWIDRAAAD